MDFPAKNEKVEINKFVNLKVYLNKKTGQMSVLLPKRKMKTIPSSVKVTW